MTPEGLVSAAGATAAPGAHPRTQCPGADDALRGTQPVAGRQACLGVLGGPGSGRQCHDSHRSPCPWLGPKGSVRQHCTGRVPPPRGGTCWMPSGAVGAGSVPRCCSGSSHHNEPPFETDLHTRPLLREQEKRRCWSCCLSQCNASRCPGTVLGSGWRGRIWHSRSASGNGR